MGPDWVWWQRQTAYVPFVGQLAGRLRWRDALPGWAAFATGLVIWLAATWAHLPAGGPAAGIWHWIDRGVFGFLSCWDHFGAREFLDDRKSVVWGKMVTVRVALGGGRCIKQNMYRTYNEAIIY